MRVKQKIWKIAKPVLRPVLGKAVQILFCLLRVFPIKNDKVLVSAGTLTKMGR